jgi:hypothetical protein
MSCCDPTPPSRPYPWDTYTYDFDRDGHVPQQIFDVDVCEEGAIGLWTWCACELGAEAYSELDCLEILNGAQQGIYSVDGVYNDKNYFMYGLWYVWWDTATETWWVSDTLGNKTTGNVWQSPTAALFDTYTLQAGSGGSLIVDACCPAAPTCGGGETGAGQWIFRGGCDELGPPPVDGRFYGETIGVGAYCYSSSYSPEDAETGYNPASCSKPGFPVFTWNIVEETNATWENAVTGEYCTPGAGVSAWLWRPCEDGPPCEHVFGEPDECPYTPPALGSIRGKWTNFGGTPHHSRPCIKGRFYGEVVWYAECASSPGDPSSYNPEFLAYDSFTRANSTSLGWTEPTAPAGSPAAIYPWDEYPFGAGDATIFSNQLRNAAVGADDNVDAVIDLGVTDVRMEATVTMNAFIAFVFRYQDQSNCWLAVISPGSNTLYIGKRVGGSTAVWETIAATTTSGTTYDCTLVVQGTAVSFTVGGNTITTVIDSTHASETKYGFRMDNGGTNYCDVDEVAWYAF